MYVRKIVFAAYLSHFLNCGLYGFINIQYVWDYNFFLLL
jgi:hypothetical protein